MLKRFLIAGIVLIALGMVGFSSQRYFNAEEPKMLVTNENSYDPVVVLELFTSQGCSSCPSADRLLEEVKKQYPKKTFTLSYHVDYWNYIGWKDLFSNSKYAEMQRIYNRKLKYRGNYTPEVVVNGKAHFVGSNRAQMNNAILTYGNERVANKVEVTTNTIKNENAEFNFSIEGSIKGKTLRAVLVLDERTTEVKRGENRNRTIKNSNIVVAEKRISPDQKNGIGSIRLPDTVQANDKLNLILLVENENHDITAAAKTEVIR